MRAMHSSPTVAVSSPPKRFALRPKPRQLPELLSGAELSDVQPTAIVPNGAPRDEPDVSLSHCLPTILWRGMGNLRMPKAFQADGGTELAACSTTRDISVALLYSRGAAESILLRIVARSFMQLGGDLQYLSAFPQEKELLFPPLTFMQPTGRRAKIRHGCQVLNVLEVEPQFPS